MKTIIFQIVSQLFFDFSLFTAKMNFPESNIIWLVKIKSIMEAIFL